MSLARSREMARAGRILPDCRTDVQRGTAKKATGRPFTDASRRLTLPTLHAKWYLTIHDGGGSAGMSKNAIITTTCIAAALCMFGCASERVERLAPGAESGRGTLRCVLSSDVERAVVPGATIPMAIAIDGSLEIDSITLIAIGAADDAQQIAPGALPFTFSTAQKIPVDAKDGEMVSFTLSVQTKDKTWFTSNVLAFEIADTLPPSVTVSLSAPADPAGYAPGETVKALVDAKDVNSGIASVGVHVSGPVTPKSFYETIAPASASISRDYDMVVGAGVRCGTIAVSATVLDAARVPNTRIAETIGNLKGGATHAAPPVVTFDSPAANAVVKPGDTVDVTVTALDDCTDVATITWVAGGAAEGGGTIEIAAGSNPATETFSFTVPQNATNGASITVDAWATDTGGFSGDGTPAHLPLTVSAILAPTAAITSPAGDITVQSGDSQSVSVSAASSSGAIVQISLAATGALQSVQEFAIDPAAPSAAHDFTVNVPGGLADGSVITLAATAYDDGTPQLTGTSGSVRLTVQSLDPTALLLFPAEGQSFNPGNSVRVSIKGTQKAAAIASVSYTAQGLGGTINSSDTFTNPTPGPSFTHDFFLPVPATAPEGTIALTGTATDMQARQGLTAVRTIDIKDNAPPTVTFTSPTEGQAFNKGDTITVTVHAVDASSNIASVNMQASGAFSSVQSSAPGVKDFTGGWDVLVPGTAASGDCYIDVFATDAAQGANKSSVVRRKVKIN